MLVLSWCTAFREGLRDKKGYPQKAAQARSSISNEIGVTTGSLPPESLSYNTYIFISDNFKTKSPTFVCCRALYCFCTEVN